MLHDAPVYGIFGRKPIGHGVRDLKEARLPYTSKIFPPRNDTETPPRFCGRGPNASAGAWITLLQFLPKVHLALPRL